VSRPSSDVLHYIDSVLQQLRSLVAVNETLKKQENEFRESCKVQTVYLASSRCHYTEKWRPLQWTCIASGVQSVPYCCHRFESV